MSITNKNIHDNFRFVGAFASEEAIAAATPNYNPQINDLWFNTTSHVLYYYTGSDWEAVELASESVDSAQLANGAVDSAQIANGAIDTAHIADAQVTASKLAANCNPTYTLELGGETYEAPIQTIGYTAAQRSCADTDNDKVTLGQITVIVIGTVPGELEDIGTATPGRRTCAINDTAVSVFVQQADTDNTTINGVAKRIALAPGGWVVLEEAGNDAFIIVAGAGVTLADFDV